MVRLSRLQMRPSVAFLEYKPSDQRVTNMAPGLPGERSGLLDRNGAVERQGKDARPDSALAINQQG